MTFALELDLAPVHEAVEQACRTGDPHELSVLGYGEISIVVAWPPEQPRWAVKRLPVFRDPSAVERYADVLDRYVAALRSRGIDVLDTTLRTVVGDDGSRTGYLVQPAVPADTLVPRLLAAARPTPDHPLLTHVIDAVVRVVDERVGLDAHLANWASTEGAVVYFDLTTPLLRDSAGRWEVDGRLLAAAVPWAVRPAVTRFVIPSIVARYHDRRLVLLDIAVNLLRLRMPQWVPPLLAAAKARADVTITPDDVRRDYRSESRTWTVLQAVRRTDRAWQRHVRRRPYPFLIPDRTGW